MELTEHNKRHKELRSHLHEKEKELLGAPRAERELLQQQVQALERQLEAHIALNPAERASTEAQEEVERGRSGSEDGFAMAMSPVACLKERLKSEVVRPK